MVCYSYNFKTAYTLQDNSVMYIWLNSTKSRGSGGMPPENFEKLNPLRLNL